MCMSGRKDILKEGGTVFFVFNPIVSNDLQNAVWLLAGSRPQTLQGLSDALGRIEGDGD